MTRRHAQTDRYRARVAPYRRDPGRCAPPAFTLVEMLVSLAVLSLALTVVGVVFTVTVDTTRQAAAYSEVQNRMRHLVREIQEDLAACNPSRSVLLLVGRTQPAALTQADLDARRFHRVLIGDPAQATGYDPETAPLANDQYSDPRADILMFLTDRPTVSKAPPLDPTTSGDLAQAAREGARFSPTMVVYGHAALAQPSFDGVNFDYPAAASGVHIQNTIAGTTLSRIPADQWHLSRRATIIAPTRDDITPPLPLSTVARDAVVVGRPHLNTFLGTLPGDVVAFDLPRFFRMLEPMGGWQYLDEPAVYKRPYQFGTVTSLPTWDLRIRDRVESLLYAGWPGAANVRHMATVVPNPPVELAGNLGLHMLPGCAWFQVEFLMPEDPRNSLEYDTTNPYDLSTAQRHDMPRWTQVRPGDGYLFVPNTPPNCDAIVGSLREADFGRLNPVLPDIAANKRFRTWPYAIRITVRAYDPRGRLAEPLVRVIEHRFD